MPQLVCDLITPVLLGATTKSTLRLPHCENASRCAQSGTGRSAPCRPACSPGSRATQCRQSLHQTFSSKCALAVLPSVADAIRLRGFSVAYSDYAA